MQATKLTIPERMSERRVVFVSSQESMELGGALEMMVFRRNSVMGGATQLRKNSVVVASSCACFHGCWIHKSSCVVSFTLFACLLACLLVVVGQ
jgi:hypothetical protein